MTEFNVGDWVRVVAHGSDELVMQRHTLDMVGKVLRIYEDETSPRMYHIGFYDQFESQDYEEAYWYYEDELNLEMESEDVSTG